MAKALHRAGIEVILDVVFNHTAEASFAHSIAFGGELPGEGLTVHRILNGYWEPLDFGLPPGKTWRRWFDTTLPSPHDIVEWSAAPLVPGASYPTGPRSVVMLYAAT